MDYTWDYLKEIGKQKQNMLLNRINRVRLKKQILLLFKLVEVNGGEMTNTYVNNDEVSIVE